MRALRAHLAALGAALVAAPACGAEPAPAVASRLLLVTFDTTRADRVGAWGHEGARTPTLDRLAREGVLFERAVTSTPVTLPSHASILTGVYPSAHGVHDNGTHTLGGEARLVSEVLHERGWRTGAFVGSFVLDASFGLDQGFEVYRGPSPSLRGQMSRVERTAEAVANDAIRWIDGLAADDRFFAWIHFYDPHLPRAAPAFFANTTNDPYDAEIAYADSQLARVLRRLEERGQSDGLLVAVTSDHGEALGEHEEPTHSIFVYQSVMHVPLLFWGESVAGAAGERVPTLVSNTAVAPTLLALAGIPTEALPEARIAPLLRPGGEVVAEAAPILLQSLTPFYSHRWRSYRGLVWREHKLIRGHRDELYALDSDPDETRDLAKQEALRLSEARNALDRALESHRALGWAGERTISGRDRELLAQLGYASASAEGDPFAEELPDPRERIGDLQKLAAAAGATDRWIALGMQGVATYKQRDESREELVEARRQLAEVRAANPNDPQLPFAFASLAHALGENEVALEELRAAEALDPQSLDVHALRAQVLNAIGKREEALASFERALEIAPRHAAIHHEVILLLMASGRREEAARRLDVLLEILREQPGESPQIAVWAERMRRELAPRPGVGE